MRLTAPLVVVTVVGLAMAGCITSSEEPDTSLAPDAPAVLHKDDKIEVLGIVDTLWEPTTQEAPPWRVGEWWKVHVTSNFDGREMTFHQVSAGVENATDSYLVGMPTHGFSNDLMVLHLPGFGQVDKQTLGYESHDCKFDPLRFPLTVGDTWDTTFNCNTVTMTVDEVTETTARILVTGAMNGHIVYDAELRNIAELVFNGYGSYVVQDHGTDFHLLEEWDGQVTVPYSHDLIFLHGRIAGVVDISQGFNPPTPNGPLESLEVGEYDRVSFSLILGGALVNPAGTTAGFYREFVTAPDGENYEATLIGPGLSLTSFKNDNPTGTWNFQHVAVGPGFAFAEGIAYQVVDIQLPDGNAIETAGEHEHEEGEGH